MVQEARFEQLDAGLTPVSDGWFVVNVREGAWVMNEALGAAFVIEGDDAPFPDVGFTLAVLQPGQTSRYHREANQEDFLVLAGDCPPDTEHGFVGVGDGPCVIFMTGARKGWPEKGIVYPLSELALRHGAGVEKETTSPAEAYASLPKWKPGPPDDWTGLPWE
jgi:hypothetical protein